MARHIEYSTHAQVLSRHPDFSWVIGIDPDPRRGAAAQSSWNVAQVYGDVRDVPQKEANRIDVAVVATHPAVRPNVLEHFPNLRAILMEKPLAVDLESAQRLVLDCKESGVLLQVNLWRRADPLMRALASGKVSELVGPVQAVTGVYGNGLRNNGIHVVDMVRMLIGEVQGIQRLSSWPSPAKSDDISDPTVDFRLKLAAVDSVAILGLDFDHYREVGLSIWGQRGRLEILNEGLTVQHSHVKPHRALEAGHEIAHDEPLLLAPSVGLAMYQLYENISRALTGHGDLVSSGASALISTQIVEAIELSHQGIFVSCP